MGNVLEHEEDFFAEVEGDFFGLDGGGFEDLGEFLDVGLLFVEFGDLIPVKLRIHFIIQNYIFKNQEFSYTSTSSSSFLLFVFVNSCFVRLRVSFVLNTKNILINMKKA